MEVDCRRMAGGSVDGPAAGHNRAESVRRLAVGREVDRMCGGKRAGVVRKAGHGPMGVLPGGRPDVGLVPEVRPAAEVVRGVVRGGGTEEGRRRTESDGRREEVNRLVECGRT